MKNLLALCTAVVIATAGIVVAAPNKAAPAAMTIPSPPPVDARSFILMNHDGDVVLAENNADERTQIASVTKIMSAYVAFAALKSGQVKPDDEVLISARAWKMGGSQMFVEVGKRVKFDDLLHGMIIQSGNDAAVAIAEHIGGSFESFVDLMNQEAQRLGMRNSHFASPNGLPNPDAYSTARDVAIVSSAIIRDFPEYYPIFSQSEFEFNGIKQYSHNKLLGQENGIDGLKTGFTNEAGYCLSASQKKGDTRMIAVVLGAKKPRVRDADVRALLNFGLRFYETRKLYAAGQAVTEARVWKGDPETVPVGLEQDLMISAPRGKSDAIKASMEIEAELHAPVTSGQKVGMVHVMMDGNAVRDVPLVALKEVPVGGFMRRISDTARMGDSGSLWPWIAGVVVIGAGAFLVLPKLSSRRRRS